MAVVRLRRERASKLKLVRVLREKLTKGLAGARGAVVKSFANHAIVHQKRVRGSMIAFCPRFEQCNPRAIVRPDGGVTRGLHGNPGTRLNTSLNDGIAY